MNEYFLRPEVSNSELQSLRRAYYNVPDPDLEQVFKFGNLVDALLTTPTLVSMVEGCYQLMDDDGIIRFTRDETFLAYRMYKACLVDPVIREFIRHGSGQHVFTRDLLFTYEDAEYTIKARCKFDSIYPAIRTGVDYKTTSCTTRKAFIASIEHFNYDQQAAWYLDTAGTDRHWIIGISKKTKEIFKFAIQRGDETYQRGRSKYSFWSRVWLMLFENFILPETV